MTPSISGLKRSMPCTDLYSMLVCPSPTTTLIKDYDSDDASATSCMVFPSRVTFQGSHVVLADSHHDCFIDDVWDFVSPDDSSSRKRQKRHCNVVDNTVSMISSGPASDVLEKSIAESQATLDKLMHMHIDMVAPPSSTVYPKQSCMMHTFSKKDVDISCMTRTYA
jgi:hypothetical protein